MVTKPSGGWHAREADEVLIAFGGNRAGRSNQAAEARLAEHKAVM